MYSDISMRTMAWSSSNRKPASARESSVLPTPVGPRNMNEPMGRFGSCKPCAGAPHRGGNRMHRLGLADDALAKLVLHPEQLVLLALEHLFDRDAGPARHDARDMIGGYGLLHHAAARIRGVFHGLQPFFEIGYDAIGQLAGPREIAFPLNLLKLDARSVQLLLDPLRRCELLLFLFPAPGEASSTSLPGRRFPFAAARACPWTPDRSLS